LAQDFFSQGKAEEAQIAALSKLTTTQPGGKKTSEMDSLFSDSDLAQGDFITFGNDTSYTILPTSGGGLNTDAIKCGRCGAGLSGMDSPKSIYKYFRCRKHSDMKSCEGCGLTTRLRKQTQKGNY
jgi:hypothetical protein